MNAKFDHIIHLERQTRHLRITGFEQMSDYQYAQRVAALRHRKAELFAAIDALTADEMEAFGIYRTTILKGVTQ